MARIAGVDLPKNKRAVIGLMSIFGIGKSSAQKILKTAEVDENTRIKDLDDQQVNSIRQIISDSYRVEGDLRTEINLNIKRLMDIGSYRGYRHRIHLPVRGQRTKTNARTRKGVRRTVAGKKKVGK